MSVSEWQVIWFTVQISVLSVALILPWGVGLAWLLARRQWFGKSIVETLITLPLVMPPVAVGLLLLKLFSRRAPVGYFLEHFFKTEIVFTWRAVVIAMSVMSFPLLVRAARVAFEGVNPRLEQVARTLGANPLRVFFSITLPLASRGIAAGVILSFARALGEFGATILVAGNIPGKTSTLSLSIYQGIQLGQDCEAFRLVGVAVIFSFVAVWASEWFFRRDLKKR